MKRIAFLLAFVLTAFIGNYAFAQEGVSKAELLSALNKADDLNLSGEKSSALKNFNEGFADEVFDITDSNKSDEEKIVDLKNLRDRSEKDLMNLIGDDAFKSFKKSLKKELKPLKRKTKLLKWII